MRHSLWLTIQSPSPTICQPQHSAGRGDKDQCDEKQHRCWACPPFVIETLTPGLPQNQSKCFLVRMVGGLFKNFVESKK
jgi:hypothetical protein